MSELLELYSARVRLGDQTREFLRTELGKYLVEAADVEIAEGHEALEVADSMEDVRSAQARVWRGRSFIEWLQGAIELGDEARSHIEHGNID
jgi:hypothetical protein